MKLKKTIILGFVVTLAACTDTGSNVNKTLAEPEKQAASTNAVKRVKNFSQITRGSKVFQQSCASCHGAAGEGQSGEGKLPVPALDGSAHSWHHSNAMNRNTIMNGTKHLGGSMPAWKDKLTEEEITDVMAWFQSKWSDEVYQIWYHKVENKNN